LILETIQYDASWWIPIKKTG